MICGVIDKQYSWLWSEDAITVFQEIVTTHCRSSKEMLHNEIVGKVCCIPTWYVCIETVKHMYEIQYMFV